MSCFIMNTEPLATISCGIEKMLNMGHDFHGISVPASLRDAFANCADNYGLFDAKKICNALYALNTQAYNGRYNETVTMETPTVSVPSYNIFKRAEYADRHFTVEPWHYKYAKLLECYVYQVNEDATRRDSITLALQELINCLHAFIVHNSALYTSANWGEPKKYSIASESTDDGVYLVKGTKYVSGIKTNRFKAILTPDEWDADASIWFLLRSPEPVKVFSDQFELSHVVLHSIDWHDAEMVLTYACQIGGDCLLDLPIFEELKREIYDLLCFEETKPNKGILKNHVFSDHKIFTDYE